MSIFWRPRGCVLWYDFAELSGHTVYDLSGNGNHGTIYNAEWRRGHLVGSLYFNGTDAYVDCGADESLGLDILTHEALVKTTETAPEDNVATRIITNWRAFESTKITLKMWGDYAELMWYTGTTWARARSSTRITDGKWYHLVGTYDGSVGRIYVNGVLEDETEAPLTTENYYRTLIGTYRSTEGFFNGLIAFVRIYNRALTLSEIRAHYHYLTSLARQVI